MKKPKTDTIPTTPRRGPPEGSKNAKKASAFDASITIRCFNHELTAWDNAKALDESRGDFIRRACNIAAMTPLNPITTQPAAPAENGH